MTPRPDRRLGRVARGSGAAAEKDTLNVLSSPMIVAVAGYMIWRNLI
ncbi:hypothetical protein PV773_10055 [Mesorhizobium sp. CC13]